MSRCNPMMLSLDAMSDQPRRLLEVYWLLMTRMSTFIEDIRGVDGRDAYLEGLATVIVEDIWRLEELISGQHACGEMHRLASAFEFGLPRVSGWSGEDLLRWFFDREESDWVSARAQDLEQRCLSLRGALPGSLPDTLSASGQRAVLKILRNWAAIAKQRGVGIDFLSDYLKSL